MPAHDAMNQRQFFHGTTAALTPGTDQVEPGHEPVWGDSNDEHVYFTSNRKAAGDWAGKSAKYDLGGAPPRVYKVQPTGDFEVDKQSANSYRSKAPLNIVEEIAAKSRARR